MDKIVGKIVSLIVLVGTFFPLYTQVTLRSLDAKGVPIQQAVVGVPFKLEVALEGQSSMQRPLIQGLERVQVGGQETKMQIVNGRSSIKHIYTIRADTAGSYTFGPAEIVAHNKRLMSSAITLTVTDTPTAQATSPEAQKKEPENLFFVRLLVDKHHVVVGEHLQCTLQIFSAEPEMAIREIVPPPLEEFAVISHAGPVQSSKMHDGVKYTCIEYQWMLSAQKKPETKVIPAFRIEYVVPLEEDDDFDPLSSFFGPQLRRKRAYSNSVPLEVLELPVYNGVVNGIGEFGQLTAHLKPTVAKEGEGSVLTLEIEGSGDIYQNVPLALTNMPSALKWYDSKTYTVDSAQGNAPKRCFEYIVQGIESGSFEIPSQTFTYFDTTHHTYTTLQTDPIAVTIVPQAPRAIPKAAEQTQQPVPATPTELNNDREIRPLHTDVWYVQRERALPFWLFIIVLVAPLVSLAVRSLRTTVGAHMVKKSGNKKRMQAFKHARKQLKEAESAGDYAKIYPIFIELLACRFGVPYAEISEDSIEALLKKNGFTDVRYGQWHSFFATIAGLVFARQSKISLDSKDIFAQSYEWMNVLEEVL